MDYWDDDEHYCSWGDYEELLSLNSRSRGRGEGSQCDRNPCYLPDPYDIKMRVVGMRLLEDLFNLPQLDQIMLHDNPPLEIAIATIEAYGRQAGVKHVLRFMELPIILLKKKKDPWDGV